MPGQEPDKTQEQIVGVVFPMSGLNTVCEFGRQPADTAPDAKNVRTVEALTRRLRGGSRAGLTQYIPAVTVTLGQSVQHINILVDPQQPALDSNNDGGPFPDPSSNNLSIRNPGRWFREGGSGIVPNRNVSGKGPPDPLRQSVSNDFFGGNTNDLTLTFDKPPLNGSLLVVVASYGSNQSLAVPPADGTAEDVTALTNGGAAMYNQVGSTGYYSKNSITFPGGGGTTQEWALSIWYLYATGNANDITVKVGSPNNEGVIPVGDSVSLVALEYTGFASAPVGFAKSESAGNDSPVSGGTLSLSNVTGAIVIAAMSAAIDPNGGPDLSVLTPATGYRNRSQNVLNSAGGAGSGVVMDRTIKATTTTPTATATSDSTFAGISTSFNPA